MAVFEGEWVEVTGSELVTTIDRVPAKIAVLHPGWQPENLHEEVVQVVSFKFATADGKLPQPKVGEAAAELASWVRQAAEEGALDTTQAVVFSGIMIGHIAFALGEATHLFPWAGTYEPRINGAYVGHVHGARHQAGEVVFFPEK